jgi:hypothetical protein
MGWRQWRDWGRVAPLCSCSSLNGGRGGGATGPFGSSKTSCFLSCRVASSKSCSSFVERSSTTSLPSASISTVIAIAIAIFSILWLDFQHPIVSLPVRNWYVSTLADPQVCWNLNRARGILQTIACPSQRSVPLQSSFHQHTTVRQLFPISSNAM